MAKWGKVDYKQLQDLQKKIEKLQKADLKNFCEAVSKELAARLLAKVIKRTPVGDYSTTVKVVAKRNSKKHKKGDVYTKKVNKSGKVGGTLRRGWTGEKKQDATDYAQSLPVYKNGNVFTIVVKNPVEYASYVEFGHRTRGGGGWVEGRFMLTKSELEVEGQAQKIIEKKLLDFFGEVFE